MKLFRLNQPEQRGFIESSILRSNDLAVSVGPESSLASTAVLAAVRVLSESIASLPLIVYQRNGRAKERAPQHPLYPVLHDLANPEMTAFSFRRLQVAHQCLYGNAYAEIEWNAAGQIVALWPMHPSRVGVERNRATGALEYTYYSSVGKGIVLPSYRVFHTKWLESDGVVGQSPIQLAAGAVGLSLAMDKFANSYFSNGARPSLVLKYPNVLKPEAYERLRASFSSAWSGLTNAHRVQILEQGVDIAGTIGVPPEEAQLLEARKFQVTEVARMYRVPPHLLGDLERSTFSNIEHQGIEFLQYTLSPMLVSQEQEIRRQLMTLGELERFDVEHIVDGLLRGDTATRFDVYVKATNNAIMSVNEVRALENLPPIEDGDTYYMPLNLAPLGSQRTPTTTPDQSPANSRSAIATADIVAPLVADVAQRLVKRAAADIERQGTAIVRKHGQERLREWWNEELRASLVEAGMQMLEPVTQTFAAMHGHGPNVEPVLRQWAEDSGRWATANETDGSLALQEDRGELVHALQGQLMEVFK